MSFRSLFSSFKNKGDILESIKKNANVLKHESTSSGTIIKPESYDKLVSAVGSARVVMIGEASHGTYEFYKERAEITKRLIKEKQFNCITVEADWPDAYKINRYVCGLDDCSKTEALSEFKRFPRWMWRNEVMLEFIEWLKDYNDKLTDHSQKVGFYGLDLYSMFESAHEVVDYLTTQDQTLAKEAKNRYACFERYGSTQKYGYATSWGLSKTCEDCVTKQLIEMVKRYDVIVKKGASRSIIDKIDLEDEFYAKMNATVVKDAEEYYRKMFSEDTWNLRDTHMANCLIEILKHRDRLLQLQQQQRIVTTSSQSKAVVWAHNSHLGDASYTDSWKRGETNLGKLIRDKFSLEGTFNIGLTTYNGTVTASSDWDCDYETKKVNPSLESSHEILLHDSQIGNFYLLFRSNNQDIQLDKELIKEFQNSKQERFIGVIYRPDTEKQSHYYGCKMANQFDAVLHIDRTRGIRPMDRLVELKRDEQETFPTGL